jgi:hypothetical protein
MAQSAITELAALRQAQGLQQAAGSRQQAVKQQDDTATRRRGDTERKTEIGGQTSEVRGKRSKLRISDCGFGKAWSIGKEISDFGLRIANL